MTDPSAATTGGSVLRGGFWHTASRIIPQFYALAISIVAARFLGPDDMGRQSLIAFAELSLAALLSNGLFLALMRYVGEAVGRGNAGALHGLLAWAWRVQAILALVGGVVLVAVASAGAEPRNAWLLAAFVCVLTAFHAVPSAVLIGVQRWREASIVGLSTGLLATGASIAVLSAGGGITGMFAVEAAISVLNLGWTGRLARRALDELGPVESPSGQLRHLALRAAAVLSLSELLALVVERRSEVFLLAKYSGDAEIAHYSIVFAVVTALVQLPYAMAAAVSPAVATLFGAGAVERIRSGYERGLRLLLFTALPLTAAGLSVGPALLRVIYGDEYRATGPVLLISMAIFPLIPLGGLASALLTGIGRLRLLLTASAFAATVDVVLALLLIPRFDAAGAALANAGAQTVLTTILLGSVHWLAGSVRLESAALARAVVAATATGAVGAIAVFALGDLAGVIVGGLAGIAAFALLAVTLKILPREDAAWLDQTMGGSLGGRLGRFVRASSVGTRSRP